MDQQVIARPLTDLKIDVDELAARLPDEQRLAVATALVIAAFKLCPPPQSEDNCGPDRVALANSMLAAVNALLQSQTERRRDACWQALEERRAAIAAHDLH
jgi:hypothetical protein